MISFVVMWLAMAGGPRQQPTEPVFWHTAPNWTTFSESESSQERRPYIQFYMDKPHVIEIRTKRTLDTVKLFDCDPKDSSPYCGHPEPRLTCPDGQLVYDFARHDNGAIYRECPRVTKTLWIDGVKVGTIREVEEK